MSDDVSLFVNEGGSPSEILLTTIVGPCSVLLRNLAIPWIFFHTEFDQNEFRSKMTKLLIDHLCFAIPNVLSLTVLANHVSCMLFTLVVSCALLLLFRILEFCTFAPRGFMTYFDAKSADYFVDLPALDSKKPTFLINFRALVYLSTAICILAVDFRCFPIRFSKTINYGFSLMDTGVGVFTFLYGVTAREFRTTFVTGTSVKTGLLSSAVLLALGLLRTILIKLIDYNENVIEYGLHWNFFLTLAVVKIFLLFSALLIDLRKFGLPLSILMITLYQFVIYYTKLDSWIFGERRDFSDFVDSNREGLASLFGYVPLALIGGHIGKCILSHKSGSIASFRTLCKLASYSAGFAVLMKYALHYVGPASRRLANLTYYLWIVSFSTFHLAVFYIIEAITTLASSRSHFFSRKNASNIRCGEEPCLLQLISKRGLLYFVTANLLTGLMNMTVKTRSVETLNSLCSLFVYSLILSGVVVV